MSQFRPTDFDSDVKGTLTEVISNGAGLSFDPATNKLSLDSSGIQNFIDSDYIQSKQITTFEFDSAQVESVIDTDYIQSRQITYSVLDSADIQSIVDAQYIQSLQTTYDFLDSAEAIALFDSAYVQSRQTQIDSDYIQSRQITYDFLDSSEAIALFDSAYVQSRQLTYDFLDSSEVISLVDSDYVRSRQITYSVLDSADVQSIVDSAYIQSLQTTYDFLDSAEAIALFDSAYVQSRQTTYDFLDSSEVVSLIDSDYIQSRQITYDFLDSSEAIALFDSAYVQARQITYDFLDSSEVIGLVDSDYIQSRQLTYDFLDSNEVIGLVDSDYIQSRQITYDFLDSSEAIALFDSAYVQARQLIFATEQYVDSNITVAIDDLVGGAPGALDTLNELAAALGNDSDFAGTVTNQLALKFDISDFDSSFDTRLGTKTTSDVTEGSNLYYTTTRFDSDFGDNTTDDLSEGSTNLYYTTVRADSDFDVRLATKSTSDVSEGTNLYYTTVRADSDFDARLSTKSTDDVSEGSNLYYTTGRFDSDFGDNTTSDLAEGSNLYYTTQRADSDFDVRLSTKSTDDVSEGSNLYYTTTRFDSDFGDNTTDDLTEGSTNQYYTSTRVDSDFDARLVTKSTTDLSEGDNLYYTTARADSDFDARLSTKSTDDVSEGSNLYYTTTRFDSDFGDNTTDDLTEGSSNLYYTSVRVDSDITDFLAGDISTGNITTTGYLRGPSNFVIDPATHGDSTGTLTILGGLTVEGTTTTINSTTVTVDDKNVVLADNAADSAASNGAGITVGGSGASILYDHLGSSWDFNRNVEAVSIQNTPIGSSTASTGAFTTLSASGDVNFDAGTLFVDTSANAVGIGTTTPTDTIDATLDGGVISGTSTMKVGRQGASIDLRSTNSGSSSHVASLNLYSNTQRPKALAFYNNGDDSLQAQVGFTDYNGGAVINNFVIQNEQAGSMIFRNNGSPRMTITSAGNVGIGTTSPAVNLQVSSADDARIYVTDTGDSSTLAIRADANNSIYSNKQLYTYTETSSALLFGTNNTERMRITSTGDVLPGANGTQDLGSSSLRWNTVYTSDLSLKNDHGDWTIVEGEDDLFLYNNKKNKVYKFALTEVDPSIAPAKRD